MDRLTPNEYHLMMLVADGLTNKEIAALTHKAESTVKNTLLSIRRKLGAKNTPHAVAIMGGLRCGSPSLSES